MSDSPAQEESLAPLSDVRRRRLTVVQWLVLLIVAFFLGPLCVSNLWGYLQTRS